MEGRFNGGFFALPDFGGLIMRGLFSEFYGISYAAVTRAKRDQTENREWRLDQQSTQNLEQLKCTRLLITTLSCKNNIAIAGSQRQRVRTAKLVDNCKKCNLLFKQKIF